MTPRLAALLAAPAVLIAVACSSGGTDTPRSGTVQAEAVDSPSPSPSKYKPLPTDFELTVKITEKQCFGEAGCNLTFRVETAYGGLPLDEADEWLITYTITGDESGPQINSFTLRGTQVTQDSEESMSTKSGKVVPKATVTSVAPN